MTDFPDSFPISEIMTVIKALRGGPFPGDLREVARSAWVVVGFAAGQALPAAGMAMGAAGDVRPSVMSSVECADHLERCCKSHEGSLMGDASGAAVPWDLIVPVVLDLFKQWWQRRQLA